MSRFSSVAAAVLLFAACTSDETARDAGVDGAPAATSTAPQDVFWANLQALCDRAAPGVLLQAPEGDTQIDPNARLVVHS